MPFLIENETRVDQIQLNLQLAKLAAFLKSSRPSKHYLPLMQNVKPFLLLWFSYDFPQDVLLVQELFQKRQRVRVI